MSNRPEKMVRVCDPCFQELVTASSNTSVSVPLEIKDSPKEGRDNEIEKCDNQPLKDNNVKTNPKLSQIASLSPEFGVSAGLWWDSFEEETDFDSSLEFGSGLVFGEGEQKFRQYFQDQLCTIRCIIFE